MSKLQHFLRDEDGVAAIEYGLLAGLIAVAIILSAQAVGLSLQTIFGAVNTALTTAAG